jgi:hypothetical protein
LLSGFLLSAFSFQLFPLPPADRRTLLLLRNTRSQNAKKASQIRITKPINSTRTGYQPQANCRYGCLASGDPVDPVHKIERVSVASQPQ